MIYSSVFYLFIGLFFLSKVLNTLFTDFKTSILLVVLFLGSNLFYYSTTELCMSHAYTFSLASLLMFCTVKMYQKISWLQPPKSILTRSRAKLPPSTLTPMFPSDNVRKDAPYLEAQLNNKLQYKSQDQRKTKNNLLIKLYPIHHYESLKQKNLHNR